MESFNEFILYFFYPTPGRAFGYYYFVGALAAIMAIVGVILRVYIKKNREDKGFRKLFRKFPSKLWILAASLMLYMLVRYNYIPFFSMRFLLYILLGLTIYLFYQIINTYLKIYPFEKSQRQQRLEQNKYIVSKKKKKRQ